MCGHPGSGTGTCDQRISACTAVIESGKWVGKNLAWAFNDRGLYYANTGNHDRAIPDYTEAIRLNPQYAHAFMNRGASYRSKHDYDRAMADANEAIRLNPQMAPRQKAYIQYCRGAAELKKGDAAAGNADITAAKAIWAEVAEAFDRYVMR